MLQCNKKHAEEKTDFLIKLNDLVKTSGNHLAHPSLSLSHIYTSVFSLP